MEFLPNEYKIPTVSKYMKFVKGPNKFRVLSSAVVGWSYWSDSDDGKRRVTRVKNYDEVPAEYKVSGQDGAKHFWAFAVYNYQEAKVQILEVTQKSVMNALKNYSEDADWGNPTTYDMVVTKTGDGKETEYLVTTKPKSKLDIEVPNINLSAFFTGEDPFTDVLSA